VERVIYWRIVEAARAEAGSDTERVARALLRRLRDLSPAELEDFQVLWEQAQNELYRWPVHDAAELLLGPLDSDGLFAVQDWIVSHGRRVVTDEVSIRQRFPKVMAYLDENTWIKRPWEDAAN
jgi:hypothetical protein